MAGKFDPAQVLAWVAKGFGSIPKPTRALQRTYTVEQPQDGEHAVTVRRVGGAPMLMAGWQVMAGADPDHTAIEAIANILGDAPSGRLHKRLVQRQLAASVFACGSWPGESCAPTNIGPGSARLKSKAKTLAANWR